MSIHARFSINLDEDYELFGIDPNENLDDWSFLDAKPKPIEEKTEEEKQLFQRLLTPTISEEEIQTKIHDKLKTLIKETSDFIKNDLKVELSEPIELPPEEVKKQIDENSFEHKQAVRMSTIVKDIFETTQKAENITDFVKDITRSDEIAKEIETSQTDNNIIETPPKPKEVPPQITEVPKDIQPIKEEQHEHKASNFLNRYTKKRNPINTILKEQEETERMKSKFLQERKKREEAAAAEIELQKKSMQEKQKQFFDDIEKEVEKHRREIQMVNEVKNSHQPSTAEILNQIKQQETPKVEIKQKQIKKERSKPKPPILTSSKINEFYELRQKTLNENSQQQQQQKLKITLLSENKIFEKEPKYHYSKTFQSNLIKNLSPKLKPILQEKKKKNISCAMKITIFLLFSFHFTLLKKRKQIQHKKLSKYFNLWKTMKTQKMQQKVINKKSILERTRDRIHEYFPEKEQTKEKPKIERKFDFPLMQEIDVSWMNQTETNSFELSDDFLDELPDKPKAKKQKMNKNFQAESKSIPLKDDIDEYLEKFNKPIVINENEETKENKEIENENVKEKEIKNEKIEVVEKTENKNVNNKSKNIKNMQARMNRNTHKTMFDNSSPRNRRLRKLKEVWLNRNNDETNRK